MNILGLSAFYHDSAAALVSEGRIVAAAQEERFTRKKHDASFPENAIAYCLQQGKLAFDDIDYVVFYDKPFLKFERLLETYLAFAPRGFTSFAKAIPLWIREKLFQKQLLLEKLEPWSSNPKGLRAKLLFSEHHFSHAASAFFASPFETAAVLTMDGVGEWATTSCAIGSQNTLTLTKEIHFPHSLGLLYSAFTYFTGFKVNSGEYKLMGLAPYGQPLFVDQIRRDLVDIKDDGSFRLNLSFFDYCTGLRMTNERFSRIFGVPVRKPEEELKQVHMDIAASIQAVTEEIMLKLARSIAQETGLRNLCLAGGVALNCVANGKILKNKIFDKIWIQPAAGDAGGALGAALACHYLYCEKPRSVGPEDTMHGSFLGPEFSQTEIEKRLESIGAKFETMTQESLLENTAKSLAASQAIGWFQGRMEFGPRALGNRSIIADARSPSMQKMLNLKIKFRESFRPFAPSILAEEVAEWFDLDGDSPYMLLVADVQSRRLKARTDGTQNLFGLDLLNLNRSEIPAVTHVDNSARVQTVSDKTNGLYYGLIKKYREMTGCPVIVNTSFNVRGEPIVCTPEDAFKCFMGTQLDVLAIGRCFLKKEDQNRTLAKNYEKEFELD